MNYYRHGDHYGFEQPSWRRQPKAPPPGPKRPPLVFPTAPPVPEGCAGFVRKFRPRGYGWLLRLVGHLEVRANSGTLDTYQRMNDGRQLQAAQYLLKIHQGQRLALATWLAIPDPDSQSDSDDEG